jgi:FkbM family methyltransferase
MISPAELRARIKLLVARRRGHLAYFGERLRFPPDMFLVERACREGIYERDNLRLLQVAARADAWYFDIGANIGLMSAPLLQAEPRLHVVSVEPSPSTRACLAASIAASANRHRWRLVDRALGENPGKVRFHAAAAGGGAYDGFRDTGRSGGGGGVEVEQTTLDALWTEFGRPPVCAVKIDTEGAETFVLRGGRACLAATRPVVLIEWNPYNLAAFGLRPESLPGLAAELGYHVLTTPGLAPLPDAGAVDYLSRVSETFLLMPKTG